MCFTVRWMAEAERWVAVPTQRDGWHWLCQGREMGGCAEAERWVAEADRWVSQ